MLAIEGKICSVGDKALDQVAQGVCGISICGQSPEQPAWTLKLALL